MKTKHLLWALEELKGFEKPKVHLEQYKTSAEMAVSIGDAIVEDSEPEMEELMVGDFGCGPGILMCALALMGAKKCVGFEVDTDVIEITKKNIEAIDEYLEEEQSVEVVQSDILSDDFKVKDEDKFDIIIMNPPFGTKNNEGVDLKFVRKALECIKPTGKVYSLHKTSTREGIARRVKAWDLKVEFEPVAELNWELEKTYKFHKKGSVDIQVDLLRFRFVEDGEVDGDEE